MSEKDKVNSIFAAKELSSVLGSISLDSCSRFIELSKEGEKPPTNPWLVVATAASRWAHVFREMSGCPDCSGTGVYYTKLLATGSGLEKSDPEVCPCVLRAIKSRFK